MLNAQPLTLPLHLLSLVRRKVLVHGLGQPHFAGGTDVAQLANIQAASTAFRTVAHGIRISSTLAPTAATGFVHIAVYS